MQLLRCDRCNKTESGYIIEPREERGAWGYRSIGTERRPSITGWELIRIGAHGLAALLCSTCVQRLRAWLTGEDGQSTRAN